jgi:hypothetical protein
MTTMGSGHLTEQIAQKGNQSQVGKNVGEEFLHIVIYIRPSRPHRQWSQQLS